MDVNGERFMEENYEGSGRCKKSVRTLRAPERLTRHKPGRVAGFRGHLEVKTL
jgi:hypothetical protein